MDNYKELLVKKESGMKEKLLKKENMYVTNVITISVYVPRTVSVW